MKFQSSVGYVLPMQLFAIGALPVIRAQPEDRRGQSAGP